MSKNKYGAAKVLNVSVVGSVNAPANIAKKNIAASDAFNAGQDYNENQQGYRLPGFEWIYHIPSPGKAYNKMSPTQQLLFWATLGAIGGFALGDYVTKGPYKDTAKKTYDKLFSKSSSKAVVGAPAAVVVPAANASAVATPQVSETPYQYDARSGNPDPSIPFINGSGDKEWEGTLNWHIEQFKKFSPYDVDEFQKYLVFRAGKNPTPGIMQYTKDKREIFYTDDYYWTSINALKKMRDANRTDWGFYRTSAHETGHNKDKTVCAPTDSRCIEIPAIEYEIDAAIRAGIYMPEDREKFVNSGWQLWKKQHNYTEK